MPVTVSDRTVNKSGGSESRVIFFNELREFGDVEVGKDIKVLFPAMS